MTAGRVSEMDNAFLYPEKRRYGELVSNSARGIMLSARE